MYKNESLHCWNTSYKINKMPRISHSTCFGNLFFFYILFSFSFLINAMFVLAEMKDTIRLPPTKFGVNLQEAITNELNTKLANKV